MAVWAQEFVDPDALVIDDTGFPKDGKDSPGVARMYCGALGKTGNCQIGVSVHAVTDWASAAIDWRLFLPESWDDEKTADEQAAAEIRRRRSRSAIPEQVRHREKWRLALDMLDEVTTEWGLPRRPVVADAGYGDATEFRLGLTGRGLTYVLAVSPTATAHPAQAVPVTAAWVGNGRPPGPRYPDKPVDLKTPGHERGQDGRPVRGVAARIEEVASPTSRSDPAPDRRRWPRAEPAVADGVTAQPVEPLGVAPRVIVATDRPSGAEWQARAVASRTSRSGRTTRMDRPSGLLSVHIDLGRSSTCPRPRY
jgi:hypothetical protein